MIQYLLLGLGIGLILAGIILVGAAHIYRRRMREPWLVRWSGGIAALVGILLILIVVLWR